MIHTIRVRTAKSQHRASKDASVLGEEVDGNRFIVLSAWSC